MNARIAAFLLLCATLATGGCATEGISIPIGEQRFSPTDPAGIALLISEPSRPHVVVAMVEGVASTDDYLSEARTQAAAIEAMRKEAARVGANAVLLTGKATEANGSTTVANGALGPGYFTAVATTMGFQKIRIAGTAIRYTGEAPQ